jgi:hypothetical protein
MVKIARALLRHCIRRYASVKRITHNPYPFVSSSTMELSVLISAVKPKDRSDQYKILAALLVLNAHLVPAEAKQISELLKLHLGSRRSCIALRLRCAGAFGREEEKRFFAYPAFTPAARVARLGPCWATLFSRLRRFSFDVLSISQVPTFATR